MRRTSKSEIIGVCLAIIISMIVDTALRLLKGAKITGGTLADYLDTKTPNINWEVTPRRRGKRYGP